MQTIIVIIAEKKVYVVLHNVVYFIPSKKHYNNTHTYNELSFECLIVDKWQTTKILSEPSSSIIQLQNRL